MTCVFEAPPCHDRLPLCLAPPQTCNFDALYAYLTCGNYDFNVSRSHSHTALPFAILAHADAVPVLAQYDRIKNLRPRKNIRTAMNHEINMFACAQKEQNGLDKAVEVRFKRPHGVTSGAV